MKKAQLSPVTSLALSLAIVAGILVAGLTNNRFIPAVKAKSGASVAAQRGKLSARLIAASGVIINGVPTDGFFDGQIEIGNSTVESACGITSLGGGVYLLGAFPSGESGVDPSQTGAFPSGEELVSLSGAFPSGEEQVSLTGAFPSGEVSAADGGAFPSGEEQVSLTGALPSGEEQVSLTGAFPSGEQAFVGGDVQVSGGVLEGENIHVANGVIRGKNLRLVGTHVTASCAR